MGLILLILLIVLLVFALPNWSYSRRWGYKLSGSLALLFLFVIILTLSGRLS